mgnify:CR=1 FL=1
MRRFTSFIILLTILALSGCASNIAREIKQAPTDNPTVREVRDDIDRYTGNRVRWGGTIAAVENRENETWIEVVALELDGYGRPEGTDSSHGRFLVRIDQFIDPEIYARGRELTIVGNVESRIVRKIGEHPYTYPLIRATSYHLWPQYNTARNADRYYRGYYGGPYSRYGFGAGYAYPHHHYWHPYY